MAQDMVILGFGRSLRHLMVAGCLIRRVRNLRVDYLGVLSVIIIRNCWRGIRVVKVLRVPLEAADLAIRPLAYFAETNVLVLAHFRWFMTVIGAHKLLSKCA